MIVMLVHNTKRKNRRKDSSSREGNWEKNQKDTKREESVLQLISYMSFMTRGESKKKRNRKERTEQRRN